MSRVEEAMAAIRRADQVYCQQLTQQTALSCGVAHTYPETPHYHDGNHLREVIVPEHGSLTAAWDETEQFYSQAGLKCHAWVPAGHTPIDPLEAFLTGKGCTTRRSIGMAWTKDPDIAPRDDVRVLPARAMRKACRAIRMQDDDIDEDIRSDLADIFLERLDEPQFDHFVATVDDEPAAAGTLFQVGEIGLIEDILVLAKYRGQGVARSLMAHLLAMSKRLALRITVVTANEHNTHALTLYERCGFERVGVLTHWHMPSTSNLT